MRKKFNRIKISIDSEIRQKRECKTDKQEMKTQNMKSPKKRIEYRFQLCKMQKREKKMLENLK